MHPRPEALRANRVRARHATDVVDGQVHWEPVRSLWITVMMAGALIGAPLTFSWSAFAVFVVFTVLVLLLGHSLGMHRKLIHNSYQCPKWLEYFLVYCGVLVGLAGPLALLRTHDLRDYAQRMPDCHDFLGHRRPFLMDGWWQLHCELALRRPPQIPIEPHVADDSVYRFLQRTWMLQQLPWAVLLYGWGGWGFVFWGVCARVTAGVGGHWLIGYFAHNHGQLRHEVPGAAIQGRNVRFVSLLTMGESWHNNHHAFPGSARIGLYPGEWDPGWWFLQALERVRLVWDIRVPQEVMAPCRRRHEQQAWRSGNGMTPT